MKARDAVFHSCVARAVAVILPIFTSGVSVAGTFTGSVDGQLDNSANWKSYSEGMTMGFSSSYGTPLYLGANMTQGALSHSSSTSTLTNEFALGADKVLSLTNAKDTVTFRGADTLFKLTSGTMRIGEQGGGVVYVGNGAAENCTVLVTGKDAAFDMCESGGFNVGWGVSSTMLALRDGASFTGRVTLGLPNESSNGNIFLVADSETCATMTGVDIGARGSDNVLVVSNGATFVSSGEIRVPGAYGNVTTGQRNVFRVDGATATLSGNLKVGLKTSSNRVEVVRGGVLSVSTIQIGDQGTGGKDNTVTVSGKESVLRVADWLTIGNSANLGGGLGLFVKGGTACFTGTGSHTLTVGGSTPGTLEISEGGLFAATNATVNVGAHSSVVLNDGVLLAGTTFVMGDANHSTAGILSISGHCAQLSSPRLTFKGDTVLNVTVPAEGFGQTPISGMGVSFVSVAGVDGVRFSIDTSAFTEPRRLVIVQSETDIAGLSNVMVTVSPNAVLDLSNPKEIAVLANIDLVCTGLGGESWNDANNWSNIVTGAKTVPTAGQAVVVAPVAAKTLVLDAPTSDLKSLEIGGAAAVSLVLTNWTTAVRADVVTIRPGAVVTCAGPFTDMEMSNRVWIVCRDLTIDDGGKIDVNGRGFVRGDKVRSVGVDNNSWPGFGPGARVRGGSTHGGYGGAFAVLYAANTPLQLPIGDVEEPELPGSGGAISQWSSSATDGGGAVRIDATGTVTVNGQILASVQGLAGGTYVGGGAGGSILIHAATFKGRNGMLKAEGGSTNARVPIKTNEGVAFPGGGGRIAIHYVSAETSGMTVSAREGLYSYLAASNDYNRVEADMGTLYFSDDSIWLDGFGSRITGIIANPCAKEYDFDEVAFTSGRIRFGMDGLTFRMKSLSVAGDYARFEIGGSSVEQVTGYRECRSAEANALEIEGDLTVSDKGRLDVRAASAGDADGVGAMVMVGGALTVGAQGYLYSWCDVITGARPRFVVSNSVTVAEGGVISAERRGFAGGHNMMYDPIRQAGGHGSGAGYCYIYGSGTAVGGGGHGGKGSISAVVPDDWALTNGIVTADGKKHPTLAGGGGGQATDTMWGSGSGGGVVDISSIGRMTVDGLIIADGEPSHGVRVGAGAGGSIVLSASKFGGAGTLSAKGGSLVPLEMSSLDQAYRSGVGGGGRIGIITGLPYVGDVSGLALRLGVRPVDFTGTTDVTGGVHPYDGYDKRWAGEHETLAGGDGTVCFSTSIKKPGLVIIFR